MRISKIIPTLILFHLLLLVGVAAVTARESRPRYTNEPAADITDERIVIEPIEVNGDAVYIVRLKDDPLATYRGGIGTIEATNPATLGRKQLDMSNSASTTYLEYLATEQDKFLSAASKILDRDITPIYQYDVVYNGVAFEMSSAEAKQVARIPGVINVQHDSWRYKETDVTPNFVGATNIWDGSAFGGISSKGEGIIVGVIDTGIWPEHPSFVDDGSYLTPVGWNGGCSSPADGSPSYVCNNKLVGAQHFLAGYTIALGGYDGLFNSARDDDGHGTHTASTAAGNENVAVTLLGVNRGSVSGMAPRAHIAAYKGLGPQGGLTSDLVAAIEAAVADGVDVINYSIGGGANDPWNDADAQAFLAARSAGVFVATSAGNSGPNSGTVGSPGDSPWITTVGASTSNRRFISEITIFGPGSPPSGLFGAAISAGIQNFNLVDAEGIYDSKGDNSGLCLNPF
ncbi:MAG: S8 family serine peptidase, partial [Candidatus Promineifilaceae bacterium]|nr:S8 family serine peptidase [Candidatus Promineifilaceae bacterium]